MNLKLLSILSFLSLFILSCDFKDDDLIIKDNEVYEFSWCSYKESKTPAELNKELITYLGYLNNLDLKHSLEVSTRYLKPIFKIKSYDFLWLDVYKNNLEKNAFKDLSLNSELYLNWLSSKEQLLECDPKKQSYYKVNIKENFNIADNDQTYISYCKLKDGLNLLDEIKILRDLKIKTNGINNFYILVPKFSNIDFDFLFISESDLLVKEKNILKSANIEKKCLLNENYMNNKLIFDTFLID